MCRRMKLAPVIDMDTHFFQVDKKVKYLWPEIIKLPHEVTEETVHDLALPPF